MKAGTAWPWDDGNELPRVIRVIRVKGSCTFSFLRRFPYRVQRLLWQLLTHPFPSCQYADNLSWVHGVLRILYINVPKFPRHITDVVKVIECIFQRSLIAASSNPHPLIYVPSLCQLCCFVPWRAIQSIKSFRLI